MAIDIVTPASSFCQQEHLSIRRTNSSSFHHDSQSIFKRLKSHLGSNQHKQNDAVSPDLENGHPQSYSTLATRRPGKQIPFVNLGTAPPPYTTGPNAAPAVQEPAAIATSYASTNNSVGGDDPYAFLTSFDTVFLIDDSGSMAGARWRETSEALETIMPICVAHDEDGLDIHFLNAQAQNACNVTSSARVRQIFSQVQPGGGTPTGQRLQRLLKEYLSRYIARPEGVKAMNLICITDGAPSDDVESPLIAAANKLDQLDAPAWQVGVQFFQVGRDEDARRHLQLLDDELGEISGKPGLRDIVDTVPFRGVSGERLTGEGILKVVLGAVNRRIDRQKSRELYHS